MGGGGCVGHGEIFVEKAQMSPHCHRVTVTNAVGKVLGRGEGPTLSALRQAFDEARCVHMLPLTHHFNGGCVRSLHGSIIYFVLPRPVTEMSCWGSRRRPCPRSSWRRKNDWKRSSALPCAAVVEVAVEVEVVARHLPLHPRRHLPVRIRNEVVIKWWDSQSPGDLGIWVS